MLEFIDRVGDRRRVREAHTGLATGHVGAKGKGFNTEGKRSWWYDRLQLRLGVSLAAVRKCLG
jgi:hypothetical protein